MRYFQILRRIFSKGQSLRVSFQTCHKGIWRISKARVYLLYTPFDKTNSCHRKTADFFVLHLDPGVSNFGVGRWITFPKRNSSPQQNVAGMGRWSFGLFSCEPVELLVSWSPEFTEVQVHEVGGAVWIFISKVRVLGWSILYGLNEQIHPEFAGNSPSKFRTT